MDDTLAGQMLRQGLAAPAGGRRGRPGCRGFVRLFVPLGGFGFGGTLGLAFLEVADQQLELFDLAVELLGFASEAGAPERGELGLQRLDVQRLPACVVDRVAIWSWDAWIVSIKGLDGHYYGEHGSL